MNEQEPMFEQRVDPEQIEMLRNLVRGWIELQRSKHINEDLTTADADALTEKDLSVYQQYLNKTLTIEQFEKYRAEAVKEYKERGEGSQGPRSSWLSHLSNLMAVRMMQEEKKRLQQQ